MTEESSVKSMSSRQGEQGQDQQQPDCLRSLTQDERIDRCIDTGVDSYELARYARLKVNINWAWRDATGYHLLPASIV